MNKILKRLKKQAEDSLSNIINMFSIKENCLNFLEEHKQDNELYYKNGNGIQIFKSDNLEGSKKSKLLAKLFINVANFYQKTYVQELKNSKRFSPPKDIRDLAEATKKVVSLGNQTGEGWLLTGEMIELIESGVENVICMQPFGCLPNHIIGKGSIKELKRLYKNANIIPIDYDPSASEVNQINRIKLMLSKAFKNMNNNDNEMTYIDLNKYKVSKTKEREEEVLAKC